MQLNLALPAMVVRPRGPKITTLDRIFDGTPFCTVSAYRKRNKQEPVIYLAGTKNGNYRTITNLTTGSVFNYTNDTRIIPVHLDSKVRVRYL